MLQWTEKKVKVSALVPYERNPRRIAPAAYERLKASIEQMGYHQRCIAQPDGRLIGGHQRLKVFKELGIKEIAILTPDRQLTDAEYRRLLIQDNLPFGEFDFAMLSTDFTLPELEEWGMDTSIIETNADYSGLTDPDATPIAPPIPTSVLGDVWRLGDHRIMCGDSTKAEDVSRLLGDDKPHLMVTDPPYNMSATGGSKQPIGRAAARLGETIKHLCDFDPAAFLASLATVFDKGVMNAYIFCNKDLVPQYLQWAIDWGYAFNILFWKKPAAIPLGGQHRPDVEYLLFFRKSAIWNNAIKGANYSKCLEYGRENSEEHPTMKPAALIQNAIIISSKSGNCVYEPFSGSGTTIIASEMTGRKALAMEISPAYVDLAIIRWQNFTGKSATHAETGETFNEMAQRRGADVSVSPAQKAAAGRPRAGKRPARDAARRARSSTKEG